jgi:hypothetical protein
MIGQQLDLPDVHIGEVKPYEEIQLPDPDADPDEESEEAVAETKDLYQRLYGIDIDTLFDEDDSDNNTKKDNAG